MWESDLITVFNAQYDPGNKRLTLNFDYRGSLPLTIWWMDSPMGGNILEENLFAGGYSRTYHRPSYPNLYAVWFRINGVTVLEILVSEIPLPGEEPKKPKSKLPLILGGIGLAVVVIAVAGKRGR